MKNDNAKNTALIDFSKIKHINDLKKYGTLIVVKKLIETQIGVQMKSRTWGSLFKKLNHLLSAIDKNNTKLKELVSNENSLRDLGDFKETKIIISKLVSHNIKAHGWKNLKDKLVKLFNGLTKHDEAIDKFAFYEKNKMSNFISSSSLEGLNINNGHFATIEDVIKKFKVG